MLLNAATTQYPYSFFLCTLLSLSLFLPLSRYFSRLTTWCPHLSRSDPSIDHSPPPLSLSLTNLSWTYSNLSSKWRKLGRNGEEEEEEEGGMRQRVGRESESLHNELSGSRSNHARDGSCQDPAVWLKLSLSLSFTPVFLLSNIPPSLSFYAQPPPAVPRGCLLHHHPPHACTHARTHAGT